MSIAIDIAWDRPTVAQIKATGAIGVLRYFSTDSTKNLTAAEVAEYHAAGLATGDVWETTTGRATQGYQAGIDDATMADGQRKADGLPSDQAIYFAVDEDTDWASVSEYFRGAHVVLGNDAHGIPRAGCYGGFRVIEGAYGAGFRRLWQTLAWSGGRRSAHACLYQNGATVLGGAADINDVLASDWGQYPSPSGGDMPLTADDARTVWGYHGPGDSPDAHQTLQNIATGVTAANKAIASVAGAVANVATAVAKLGGGDAALLADLQAAEKALAGIPAMVEAALKDGTVHVDVAVTGPAAPPAPAK